MRYGEPKRSGQTTFPKLRVIDNQIGGRIGADSHETRMAYRELPGEACDQVQRHRQDDVDGESHQNISGVSAKTKAKKALFTHERVHEIEDDDDGYSG